MIICQDINRLFKIIKMKSIWRHLLTIISSLSAWSQLCCSGIQYPPQCEPANYTNKYIYTKIVDVPTFTIYNETINKTINITNGSNSSNGSNQTNITENITKNRTDHSYSYIKGIELTAQDNITLQDTIEQWLNMTLLLELYQPYTAFYTTNCTDHQICSNLGDKIYNVNWFSNSSR